VEGIPNVYVNELRYEVGADILYLATMGRGVWFVRSASTAFGTLPPTQALFLLFSLAFMYFVV